MFTANVMELNATEMQLIGINELRHTKSLQRLFFKQSFSYQRFIQFGRPVNVRKNMFHFLFAIAHG